MLLENFMNEHYEIVHERIKRRMRYEELFEIVHIDPFCRKPQMTLYEMLYPETSHRCNRSAIGYGNTKITVITFSLDGNEHLENYNECLEMVKDIVEPVRNADRYTQMKYVNDYLCNTITFDSSTYRSTLKNALIDKYSNSAGYAYAFQACMEELEDPCYIVSDYCTRHFFNVVELEGNWYWVSSGKCDKETWIDYTYFLCGTNVITDEVDMVVSSTSYGVAEEEPTGTVTSEPGTESGNKNNGSTGESGQDDSNPNVETEDISANSGDEGQNSIDEEQEGMEENDELGSYGQENSDLESDRNGNATTESPSLAEEMDRTKEEGYDVLKFRYKIPPFTDTRPKARNCKWRFFIYESNRYCTPYR